MDAQGRGRADNIDPADQWVLNPNTGDYELRLNPSSGQSAVPGPRRSSQRPTGQRGQTGQTRQNGRTREEQDSREVPGQRRRRAPQPEPAGRRRSKSKKKSKGKKALLWTGGVMAFVLVAGVGGAYLYLRHLDGNIDKQDVVGAKNGFSKDEAFNILLIGTDKRTGKGNAGYGDKNSVGHADTNILLHVAKDRSNATALSIPRDLITDIPDCKVREDGVAEDDHRNARHPLQHQPRPERPGRGLHDGNGQGDHGSPARPLHDGRLQRGQDADDGGRRCGHLPRQGRRRPRLASEALQGQAHRPGRAGPRVRAHPAQLRQPGRPGPHPAAAAVPRIADAQDEFQRHAHQPEQAVRTWPRRRPRR